MPGQRRIHFVKESDRRRSGFLDTLSQFPIGAAIYEVTSRPLPKDARVRCLEPLVDDVLAAGAQRLVIETDGAVIRHDRALLYAKVGHHKGTARLRYDHLRSYEECLLWIPDAIAWCWGRGGMWRTRVKKLITTVRVL